MAGTLQKIMGSSIVDRSLSVFHKILWRISPNILNITVKVKTPENYQLAYRPLLASDRAVINVNYEPKIKSSFMPIKNDVVVDVGANIGLYTLFASKKVGPAGKVLAFEPDESNLHVLMQNVKLNKCENVTVFPFALGSENGDKTFYEGIMPTASSFYPKSERLHFKVRKTKQIHVVTLDSFLSKIGIREVNWIKIDAEGADLDVINGAQVTLKNSKNIKLICEDSDPKVAEILIKAGFIDSGAGYAVKNH
jgi:FkbM family methyltransferase